MTTLCNMVKAVVNYLLNAIYFLGWGIPDNLRHNLALTDKQELMFSFL